MIPPMKVSLLCLIASNAFAVEAMKPDVAEPPLSQPIAELNVEPAKIALESPFESAQIIVTAKLTSGESADVTRFASVKATGGVAVVSSSGHVTPAQNGNALIDVELGGKHASIPVSVAGTGTIPKVDFIRDVNPVMTKVGCNAGTCHGAKEGKVGFKLSLRGYDPLFDVRSLKDDLAGRRLNAAAPDDSLMLLKATAGVPHEGGQRFKVAIRTTTSSEHGSRTVPNSISLPPGWQRLTCPQRIQSSSRSVGVSSSASLQPLPTAKHAMLLPRHSSRAAIPMLLRSSPTRTDSSKPCAEARRQCWPATKAITWRRHSP